MNQVLRLVPKSPNNYAHVATTCSVPSHDAHRLSANPPPSELSAASPRKRPWKRCPPTPPSRPRSPCRGSPMPAPVIPSPPGHAALQSSRAYRFLAYSTRRMNLIMTFVSVLVVPLSSTCENLSVHFIHGGASCFSSKVRSSELYTQCFPVFDPDIFLK